MRSLIPLGSKFGRRTVIGPPILAKRKKAGKSYLCSCDCGSQQIVRIDQLKKHKSCGCWSRDLQTILHTTHGLSDNPLYPVWIGMMDRCYRKQATGYLNYGGRGITVCKRWHKIHNFILDMEPRPKGALLERTDNDGNYSPKNCKWASWKEQARNRRNNRFISYNDRTECLSGWAEITGIKFVTLKSRLNHGWSTHEALTTPVLCRKYSKRVSGADFLR